MRPSWLAPSEEFRLHGALCVETQEHLLDYQITGAVVELIQEQLTGIFECLPEDNTEWWVKEIEERIAKVEALLSIYQETLE